MSKITADDALELAKNFKASALALGTFQLDNWDDLNATERKNLTDAEYTLLDHSQNLVTYAVGVILDDAEASLGDIQDATAKANQAIEKIKKVKVALGIASALVTLGAAITAQNPAGIAKAVLGLKDACDV